MKKILVATTLATLALSTSAMANLNDLPVTSQVTLLTLVLPFNSTNLTYAISTGNWGKEAELIMKDGQEYYQSGIISSFMAEKISSIQAQTTEELSVDEIVDALMAIASNESKN